MDEKFLNAANASQPKHIEVAQSMAKDITANYPLESQSEMIKDIISRVLDFQKTKLAEVSKEYEYTKTSLDKLIAVVNAKN